MYLLVAVAMSKFGLHSKDFEVFKSFKTDLGSDKFEAKIIHIENLNSATLLSY